jgi:hypothetical protein
MAKESFLFSQLTSITANSRETLKGYKGISILLQSYQDSEKISHLNGLGSQAIRLLGESVVS